MRFVESESQRELTEISIPGRFYMFRGGFPDALFRCGVGKFASELQEHGGSRRVVEPHDRPVAEHTAQRCCGVPTGSGHIGSLRSEIPGWRDDADRSSNVFINYRVVIQIEPDWIALIPSDVIGCRIIPPAVERAVVMGGENLVVEPQTEARAAESVGPDLGIFTVATNLAVVPLLGQVSGHPRMAPGERVFAVADHFEGPIPF